MEVNTTRGPCLSFKLCNPGASPKQRVEKIEGLIKKTKISGIEGDVALCRAYIDVKISDKAKQVIEKYINEMQAGEFMNS